MRTFLCFLLLPLAYPADWNRFRGPNGSGVAEAPNLPSDFAPQSAAWKTAVPFGRSSPVIAAGRLYLTASENNALLTLAYDPATGRELWRRTLAPRHRHTSYKANDPASPTPAADEYGVVAFFADFGLIAYNRDGKERWRHPLGPFTNFYGMSSSPVLAGGRVLLLCDQVEGSYLLALDAKSGKPQWKAARKEHREGWSVPIVHQDQVLTIGSSRIDSYHLSTGEPRWSMPLVTSGAMGTPVVFNDSVIITALGNDQPWMPSFASTAAKIDKDADGRFSALESKDETDWFEHFGWIDLNHDKALDRQEWDTARSLGVGDAGAMAIPLDGSRTIRWRFKRNTPYVPAPVLYDGVFYMVKTGGIVTSLDPATGTLHKQGRAPDAPGDYFASPVAAAGKVLLLSEEGKLTVLKAAPQWEVLSVNNFNEECYATPAIADARIYIRTRGTLFAFGAR